MILILNLVTIYFFNVIFFIWSCLSLYYKMKKTTPNKCPSMFEVLLPCFTIEGHIRMFYKIAMAKARKREKVS